MTMKKDENQNRDEMINAADADSFMRRWFFPLD